MLIPLKMALALISLLIYIQEATQNQISFVKNQTLNIGGY